MWIYKILIYGGVILKKAMIYVHGKGGSYLEAEQFKNICLDFDVFGVDYNDYFPWIVKNKIMEVYDKISEKYDYIYVLANSIGAYFTMHLIMKNVIVKTQALKKYYQTGNQTVRALDGVNFEVAEREFVSIVGKSGSGKSTLLHMIGGLDTPSSGTVIVDGLNLETLNSEQLALFRRRKVGFIFQQYNLIPDLNVYDNITFPLELDGTQIDKDFIQELLETLNISDKQEMLPAMLSGGEQQRVAIIRALATKPAIILADEPTGNLDTSTSHDVIGLLKMLSRQYQQTLIVITHDNDIAQMADRIVQIEDGKISTNPYCFLCGKTLVKVVFNEDAPTLDFCLINYFKSLKSY